MYQLLEYKYSSTAPFSAEVSSLMGLSLELPNMHLNETDMFYPPMIRRESVESGDSPEEPTPFLWQAPNSNAALYFGDKWVEFHSFLTSRLSLDPATTPGRPKLVSAMYPSWLEYILELMRARSYTLLYPNFPQGGEAVATMHYELFQPPEEFSKPKPKPEGDTPISTLDPQETFQTDPISHRPKHSESTPLTTKLTSLLPTRGTIVQELSDLPLLSHQGNEQSSAIFQTTARSFASDFRRQVGRCSATDKPEVEPMKADDLFCNHMDKNRRAGLKLPDLDTDNPLPAWESPKRSGWPLVVNDNDVIRQDEFEAHLSRQAGVSKGDVPGKVEERIDDDEKEKRSGEKSEKDTAKDNKPESESHTRLAGKGEGDNSADDVKAKDTILEPKNKLKGERGVKEEDFKPKNKKAEEKETPPPGRDRGW